jgi:hypothetical protein
MSGAVQRVQYNIVHIHDSNTHNSNINYQYK